jgi:hypothetical protein
MPLFHGSTRERETGYFSNFLRKLQILQVETLMSHSPISLFFYRSSIIQILPHLPCLTANYPYKHQHVCNTNSGSTLLTKTTLIICISF